LLVPEIAGSLASGDAGLAAVRTYARHYLQLPKLREQPAPASATPMPTSLATAATPAVSGHPARHCGTGSRGKRRTWTRARPLVIQPLAGGGTFALDDLPALAEALAGLRR